MKQFNYGEPVELSVHLIKGDKFSGRIGIVIKSNERSALVNFGHDGYSQAINKWYFNDALRSRGISQSAIDVANIKRLEIKLLGKDDEIKYLKSKLEQVDRYIPDVDQMDGDCCTCKHDESGLHDGHCWNCKCNFGIKNKYERKD